MGDYALTKTEGLLTYYFKCRDNTGQTSTSCKQDAMRFKSENDAIDYNHRWVYGEYEVVKLSDCSLSEIPTNPTK